MAVYRKITVRNVSRDTPAVGSAKYLTWRKQCVFWSSKPGFVRLPCNGQLCQQSCCAFHTLSPRQTSATLSGVWPTCWLKVDHFQTWANNTQHFAARWPNTRYIALKCCDRLAGTIYCLCRLKYCFPFVNSRCHLKFMLLEILSTKQGKWCLPSPLSLHHKNWWAKLVSEQ